jgi:hypothetical protein
MDDEVRSYVVEIFFSRRSSTNDLSLSVDFSRLFDSFDLMARPASACQFVGFESAVSHACLCLLHFSLSFSVEIINNNNNNNNCKYFSTLVAFIIFTSLFVLVETTSDTTLLLVK